MAATRLKLPTPGAPTASSSVLAGNAAPAAPHETTATTASGQRYIVQPTAGGSYHIWPNGQRFFVPAAGTAAPPAAAPVTPSAGSAAAAAPLDSTAAAGDALATFTAGQTHTALDRDSAEDLANYTEALRRMGDNQKVSANNASVTDHRSGLFYSGQAANDQQNVVTDYARQRADALQGYNDRQFTRSQQGAAADAGLVSTTATNAGDSASRATAGDATSAQAGTLAPVAPVGASAPPAFQTVTAANGAVYHVYPGGRKVAVKKATRKTS